MQLTKEEKDKVGKQLMLQIGQALKERKLTISELSLACSYILEGMEKASSHEDLVLLLTRLSNQWPFLTPVLTTAKAVVSEQEAQQQVGELSKLLKSNKVTDNHANHTNTSTS